MGTAHDIIGELARKAPLLKGRALIMRTVRRYLDERGFVEMHTPRLCESPGLEPFLDVFSTTLLPPREEGPAVTRYLPTSPEFAMKTLLAAGFEKIYDLGPCFRNAEGSQLHEPEFYMLEWYRAGGNEEDLMADTEGFTLASLDALGKGPSIRRGDCTVDLRPPWRRTTFKELFAGIGIDLDRAIAEDGFFSQAASRGVMAADDFDTGFYRLFITEIEPTLGCDRPAFVCGYPACMAAYARLDDRDPRYSRRFELFAAGVELANAFYEVTDPAEQRRRQQAYLDLRASLGREALPPDRTFLEALDAGLPDTAGIALGMDRLVMLLLEAQSVQDVCALPYYRVEETRETF